MGAYREIDRLRDIIENGDCRFNCRATRRDDFEAGWKAAQEFDDAEEEFGHLADFDKRYGLNKSFEEHINQK
jgi:hypothetical protein